MVIPLPEGLGEFIHGDLSLDPIPDLQDAVALYLYATDNLFCLGGQEEVSWCEFWAIDWVVGHHEAVFGQEIDHGHGGLDRGVIRVEEQPLLDEVFLFWTTLKRTGQCQQGRQS